MNVRVNTLYLICVLQNFIIFVKPIKIYKKDYDSSKSIIQLIKESGFAPETHYVTTDDGYILTIHRILNPRIKVGRPIICQHGIQSSSIDWIINSPGLGIEYSKTYFKDQIVGNNLGFALSLFGYDVWLTNSRGNYYAANHTTLSPNDDKFWQFSTDEMIEFDLPAVLAYILRVTNRKTLGYVGFSQGSRIMFGLLSERPEYKNIVLPFIAMAPVVRIDNMATPFKFLAYPPFPQISREIGGPLLLSPGFTNKMATFWCRVNQIEDRICSSMIYLIFGCNSLHLNKTRVQVYLSHSPAGCSLWTLVQYLQNFNSKSASKFDYGVKKNIEKYNSAIPPVYKLKNIKSTNIALISALNDLLANPLDVQFIRNELRGRLLLDYIVPDPTWDHISFLWGLNAAEFVNFHILRILEMFRNN